MSKPSPCCSRWWLSRRLFAVCLLGATVVVTGVSSIEAQAVPDAPAAKSGGNGMKNPRYLSLKADRVLLRQGPGADFPTSWVFKRTGLPVEIVEEVEVWRKVRDAGGTEGWVHMSLLSGRRTALILPWEIKEGQAQAPSATLRDDDRESSRAIAQVEAGVLASIIGCENGWCRVSVGNYRGYIEQSKLWGTYPNEQIKQ
jgi:SH3-like domain-containing protein